MNQVHDQALAGACAKATLRRASRTRIVVGAMMAALGVVLATVMLVDPPLAGSRGSHSPAYVPANGPWIEPGIEPGIQPGADAHAKSPDADEATSHTPAQDGARRPPVARAGGEGSQAG